MIRSEDNTVYRIEPDNRSDDDIIAQALEILRSRLRQPGVALTSPGAVKTLLKLELAAEEREVFALLLLDNRHRLIEVCRLFYGTIDGATVHTREVVKKVLQANACAVILAHNHPSGVAEPSQADQRITQRIRDALQLIDVRVLDHIVVGGDSTVSFAERGLV